MNSIYPFLFLSLFFRGEKETGQGRMKCPINKPLGFSAYS